MQPLGKWVLNVLWPLLRIILPLWECYFWKINQEKNASLLLSYEAGDTAPHCTTGVAPSSREKQKGCFALLPHILVRTESASRAFDGKSTLADLFLCFLVCVSGSQGDHQKQNPWDLNIWKTFLSCRLRKPWHLSFLHHCCQAHAGCQTHTLLKQHYRSESLTHNHSASSLEPCSDAGSSPSGLSQRFSTALHYTRMMPQKPLWTVLFRFSPSHTAIGSPDSCTHNPSKAQGLFSFLSMDIFWAYVPLVLFQPYWYFLPSTHIMKHTDTNKTSYNSAFLTRTAS